MKAILFSPHADEQQFREAVKAFPQVEFDVAHDAQSLASKLPGAEILITANRIYEAPVAATIRAHGASLKWIQFTTSGIDKAVLNGLPPGVIVTNVAGLRAFAVAEHAWFLMLALVRQMRATEQAFAQKSWLRDELSSGMDNLAGRHLVILGTGAIGQDIARKAKAFDMRVTGVSRSLAPLLNFDALLPRGELRAAVRRADFLMIAAMADDSTDKIVSREVIAALPQRAFVINIARGSLIDEPALIEALRARQIAGAALDVQECEPVPAGHPLWSLDNLLLTPHVSGAGSKGIGATHASMFTDNLKLWIAGKPLEKVVIQKT